MNTPKLIYTMNDPFIAAASGICHVNDTFYTVADDELSLLAIPNSLASKGTLIKMFEGTLPSDLLKRKKEKPDIESILYLPSKNAMLCLPSGSKPNRVKGALVGLDQEVNEITFKKVFSYLLTLFPELNLEGAALYGDIIRLFQRGNGSLHQNALIDLNLDSFLNDEVEELSVIPVDLGHYQKTPLSFTDCTCYNDECWFLAVAEDTESTFLDGEFKGAVLGKINRAGIVEKISPLSIKSKPEGITIVNDTIYLVTDDDDRQKPSKIYTLPFS